MYIYDLLTEVLEKTNDLNSYYFESEEDALASLGGFVICGEIEPASYLVATDKYLTEDNKCDAIIYDCGTLQYLYKIEGCRAPF